MLSPPLPFHARLPGWLRARGWRPWLFVSLAAALLLAVMTFAAMAFWLPPERALEPLPEPALVLLDRQGRPFARRGQLKDAPVTVAELPRHLVDAVLAIEDRRFYRHFGLDPRGIARAAAHNARAGEVEQGGSTITQQLAKNAYLDHDRTYRRKLVESAVALWLELRLDKDEILSRYLSSIYFGDGVYGLRAAARHYFDKQPSHLDLGEAALLAGLIKAPSALSPTHDPDAAWRRARVVLDAMVDAGAIDEAQARSIRRAKVRRGRATLPVGTYFADWVSPQAKASVGPGFGEHTVGTTLDLRLQRAAEAAIARALLGRGAPQAALIAMRPDGEVVAMVGGRDYGASAFNRATQARRQPGSAFKLFVYLAALREGAAPDTPVKDAPVTVAGWSPRNHDGEYRGRMSLREAFAHSSNAVAVRIANDIGPKAVIEAARDLGITSGLEPDASIALGTYETTLAELTAAYATLAAGITPVVPRGLAGTMPADAERLDPREQAMLLDLLWTAVEQGTGRAARLDVPVFGKTGTSQDHRDALFIGLAGDLVVGVWVGHDDNRPMQGITGGGLPAQIWRDFMVGAGHRARTGEFPFAGANRDRHREARQTRRLHRGKGLRGWFRKWKRRWKGD